MTGDADQHVVVAGADGSPESIAALRWASRYATAVGAPLRAVWAWHYPAAVGPAPPVVTPESISADVEQRTQQELAATIAAAGLARLPARSRLG